MPIDPPDRLPTSIAGWLRAGTLDAPLAAVVWLLAEGGLPVVVASDDAPAASALADALDPFGRPPPLLATFPRSLAAGSLEAVLDRLAAPPFELTDDATRSVGVVLVLGTLTDGRRRVTSAHYVRPLEQDPHGHVQRRPPALLSACDRGVDGFDDFAWAISAELAGRIGQAAPAFETARSERAAILEALAEAGVVESPAVAAAIQAVRSTPPRPEAARTCDGPRRAASRREGRRRRR